MESNYSTVSEDILNIYGTEGAIYINKGRLSLRSGRDKKRRPCPARAIELEPTDSLKEEIDEFFDAVADRRVSFETGVEEAINALAVIEACYRSSLERSSVEMKMLEKYF
ncbi:MAG: hypothetical protein HY701_08935 [Gemmatimonadetes bacterium]|nr:hypothetical protein [Gemmatimonadota bacterium]